MSAALAYIQAGGEQTFLKPIIDAWGPDLRADEIDQVAIDALAVQLYPGAAPSTRNRQVYTPISAVLRHVRIKLDMRRPKGAQGNRRTFWLKPEQTFALLDAASAVDAEFGIFCTVLNYCGLRLSEGAALACERLELAREYAYLPDTKTDEPRAVYLPPHAVAALANHPRGLDRSGSIFRFHKGSHLYKMLDRACEAAGVVLPPRVGFHVFRHNFATWLRLYAGLDDLGLVRTRAWKDIDSVIRYSHSEVSAEARMAAKLPVPGGEVVEIKSRFG